MDIRTLLICHLALLALHTTVLLVIRFTQRDHPGTGWLAGAFMSVTLGTGLGAARGQLPDVWSIVGDNAFIMLGYLLLHRAVAEFLGQARRHQAAGVVIFAALLVGVIYFTYGTADTQMRIATVSVAQATQVGLTASLLLRSGSPRGTRAPERFLGIVLVVLGVLIVLRGGLTLAYGAPEDFMQSNAIQAGSLLAFILMSAAIVFGFIWMTSARLHLALQRAANLDPLTGLLNRRGFLIVAHARIRAAEQEGRSILLLFADLDGLKKVNDTVGHEAGDRAICEAADVMREVLRASDSLARLGGDEFCALLAVKSFDDSTIVLQRLEERMQARNAQPGREYTVGISAAAVPIDPAEGRSLEDFLREVDRSMYATKQIRKRQSLDGVR